MNFTPPALPLILDRPPHGKVLVIAPHPDDETMGPGGTLIHHANQGDDVHVLCVCSGIQGDPEGYFPRESLVSLRHEEGHAAAAVLGIKEMVFLDYPDNLSDADISVFEGIPTDPEGARRALIHGFAADLSARIEAAGYDIVYYPWSGELNADHWALGTAVTHLMVTRPELLERVSFLGYDVWSACCPDVVIDISDVIERKVEAIHCYASQQLYRDYEPLVRGLDAYRALLLERGATYGEGFVGRYVSEEVKPRRFGGAP